MTLKNRLNQLEKQQPPAGTVADMKPSEILRRVDELLATARARMEADPDTRYSHNDGGMSSDEIELRINSLRWMVNHEQP
jgi:hypothetical protein